MACHEAFYLASTDKIYGVRENYIVKFNATTGAEESVGKVVAPMYGPMRIVGKGSTLYVASADDRFPNSYSAVTPYSNKLIWNVDATTLIPTDVLGIDAKEIVLNGNTLQNWGPRCMVFNGDDLWFLYSTPFGPSISRVDVTNPTDNNLNIGAVADEQPELIDTDGTYVFIPDIVQTEIERWDATAETYEGFCSTGGPGVNPPIAVAYATVVGKPYAVCGNTNLVRCDAFSVPGPDSSTVLDLSVVVAAIKPMRIRYNTVDDLLYIPCQNQDAVIKWDPQTETGVAVTGFDSPIDVVFTPTKSFAVQTSGESLKEII